jgi:hypothetical protein
MYWLYVDSKGNIWFNEKETIQIARFTPSTMTLVQVQLPDPDPNMNVPAARQLPACCAGRTGANTLAFSLDQEDNAWFTEFLGTHIGYIDLSLPPEMTIQPSSRELSLSLGESKTITLDLILGENTPQAYDVKFNITSSEQPSGKLDNLMTSFNPSVVSKIVREEQKRVTLNVTAKPSIKPGEYMLTVSWMGSQATFSTMIKVVVASSNNNNPPPNNNNGQEPQPTPMPTDYTLPIIGVIVAAVAVGAVYIIVKRKRNNSGNK